VVPPAKRFCAPWRRRAGDRITDPERPCRSEIRGRFRGADEQSRCPEPLAAPSLRGRAEVPGALELHGRVPFQGSAVVGRTQQRAQVAGPVADARVVTSAGCGGGGTPSGPRHPWHDRSAAHCTVLDDPTWW